VRYSNSLQSFSLLGGSAGQATQATTNINTKTKANAILIQMGVERDSQPVTNRDVVKNPVRWNNAFDTASLRYGLKRSIIAADTLPRPGAGVKEENYKIYDEEFVPTVIKIKNEPVAKIADHDSVIFFNFREDRARELSYAYVLPSFSKFDRGPYMKNLYFATMTEYEKDLPASAAFSPDLICDSLAKVISDAGQKQLHIAETEKYAHVTFFLNGQREEPFRGEERLLIPSPKIASYDEKPEMSAKEITTKALKAITDGHYDFIVINFANPDMVGHTGNEKATRRAIEVVDKLIGDIVNATLLGGGVVLITADHGNAEELLNLQTGKIDKEHSTNPVPFIIVGRDFEGQSAVPAEAGSAPDLTVLPPVGVLGDVAPTILKIMGLPQPAEMTGKPLI